MNQEAGSDNSSLRSFALFFLFAFLDERLAMEVADRAVTTFRSKVKDPESSQARKALVSICFDLWRANKKRMAPGKPSSQLTDFGQLPRGGDQAGWMRFQREAAEEEMLAILFTQVLRVPDQDICDALKISTGTLRHRVSRGIRILGDYVGPTA